MSEPVQHKRDRVRSPAYPSVDLRVAFEKAKAIYQHEKRSAVPVSVVGKHFGIDAKSSGLQRLISALKQFGLVVEIGGGADRKVKLSDLALDLILFEGKDTDESRERAKRAALQPKIHRQIWQHFEGELPSDANLRAYLIRSLDFNDSSVDAFIKEFRSTIDYVKLSKEDRVISDEDDEVADVKPVRGLESAEEMRRPQQRPAESGPAQRRASMVSTQPESGFKEAVFPIRDDFLVVRWPERLTAEDAQDVEDYLTIWLKKLKRDADRGDEPAGE
jgi:hypothetical protein